MSEVALKCQCGQVRGLAHNVSPQTVTRVICYCDDCQAFAHHLQKDEQILNAHGGTDIFQLTPAQIQITRGTEYLRCLRLSSQGLVRWYTDCCQTPIGNTISATVPFIGMVHSFIDPAINRDEVLGSVRFSLYGKFAKGIPHQPIHRSIPFGLLARNIPRILLAKFRGQNQPSPFFLKSGEPVSTPTIVS